MFLNNWEHKYPPQFEDLMKEIDKELDKDKDKDKNEKKEKVKWGEVHSSHFLCDVLVFFAFRITVFVKNRAKPVWLW